MDRRDRGGEGANAFGYRRLPGSGLTGRRGTGSGFHMAMARAHARASARSVTPGNRTAQLDRGSELTALLEDGTDRGDLGLGDNEHPASMGTLIDSHKRRFGGRPSL